MQVTKEDSFSKIITGGQTGVDRAALDVAIKLGFQHGGFCPKGRLAEDGIIPKKYKLIELNSVQYIKRTIANVTASEGSLLIYSGILSGGTLQTLDCCKKYNKTVYKINILEILKQTQVNFDRWITDNHIITLNIAGPRESEVSIYDRTFVLLMEILHYWII